MPSSIEVNPKKYIQQQKHVTGAYPDSFHNAVFTAIDVEYRIKGNRLGHVIGIQKTGNLEPQIPFVST